TTTTIKPTACPSTWSYSNFTGYCYRSVTTFSGTWMDALTFCRVWGAELASVHSLEESLFITNLVHISETNRTKQTWVGGFTDDLHATCNDNRPWNWTDGTLFDYGKLVYPCAGYGYCLFLYTGNQYTNMFQSWDCYSKMQQF
uniref:C-type lectin domain-containing protein n=1 Tax=Panagrolaimus sp. ES5 TaxID=591445 RepID=A0AC34GLE0_9BILA